MIYLKMKMLFIFLLKLNLSNKRMEIDRFTLYSFNGPFQLLHADVANLEFLQFLKYCLLFADLFASKI